MSLDITPGDGIVGELALLGDLIVGGFPEAVFTLPGVSVDEVLDHARLYLGFAEAAQTAQARVRALELPEFVGVEGEFFRGRVPGELGMQLGAAVESYSRVGSGIKELARELDASQVALKPLEARARAVFEHMQKVWVKVNVPFTEYSGLRSEWDELVRAAGVVHERVAVAGQQAAAQINAGTEAMVPVNDYFSTLPGGAVAGGALAQGVRSTTSRAVSAAGGVTGAPGRAVKATANGLGAAAGAAVSVPQQITTRGQQLAPQVTPDGIKVGDHLLTDPTSEQAQKLVREGQATNILGLDPTGIPTAMMMLASPNTLIREQRKPTKGKPGRRWTTEAGDPRTTATAKDESVVGQVVSVPGRFVGGAVDRAGNTIAGNAALIGVGGDPVRAWSGLLKNITSPVAGVGRFAASATPEEILADPVAAAGSASTHAPVAVPFVGWAYGIVEALSKPGELAREGAKETLTSALDTLTLKNLEAGQQVANTAEVHVTTPDVDVHADNGGYVTFTLPDLEGGEPKAWYILATPDSPGNFTTDVPTAPGEELIERADGSVVLVNTATSQTVRTIKTPWAKDALGRDQPTWYSIDRVDDQTSTITQHIAPNKNALYPLIADPVSVTTGGQMTSGDSPPVGPKDNQTPSNLPAASAGPSSGSSSGSSPSRGSSSNPPPARTTPVAPPPPPPPPPPPADPSSPGDDRSQGDTGPREDPGTGTGINDGSGVFDGGAHIDDGSGPITPPTGGSGSGVGAGSGFVIPGKGIDDGFSKPVDGLDDPERSKYRLLDYVIGGDKLPDQTSGPRPPDGVQVVIRDGGGYYWPQTNPDGTTSLFVVDRNGTMVEKVLPGTYTAEQLQKIFDPKSPTAAIAPKLDELPNRNPAQRPPVVSVEVSPQVAQSPAVPLIAASGVPTKVRTPAPGSPQDNGLSSVSIGDPGKRVDTYLVNNDGAVSPSRTGRNADGSVDTVTQTFDGTRIDGHTTLGPDGKPVASSWNDSAGNRGTVDNTDPRQRTHVEVADRFGGGYTDTITTGETGNIYQTSGVTGAGDRIDSTVTDMGLAGTSKHYSVNGVSEETIAATQLNSWGDPARAKLYAEKIAPTLEMLQRAMREQYLAETGNNALRRVSAEAQVERLAKQLAIEMAQYRLIPNVDIAQVTQIGNGKYQAPALDAAGKPITDRNGKPVMATFTRDARGALAVEQPNPTGTSTAIVSPDKGYQGSRQLDAGSVQDMSFETAMTVLDVVGLAAGAPALGRAISGLARTAGETIATRTGESALIQGLRRETTDLPTPHTTPTTTSTGAADASPGWTPRPTPAAGSAAADITPGPAYKPFTAPAAADPTTAAATSLDRGTPGLTDSTGTAAKAADTSAPTTPALSATQDTADLKITAADGKPRAFNADGTITRPGAYDLTDPNTYDPIRFISKDTYNDLGARTAREAGTRFERVTNRFYEDRGLLKQVYLTNRGPNDGYVRLDYLKPGDIIGSQKLTQVAEKPDQFIKYVNEFTKKYSPGSDIAPVPTSTLRGLKGRISGDQILILPPQKSPIPDNLLQYASRKRVYVVDVTGKVYNQDMMPAALPQEIIEALNITRTPKG